MTNPRRHLVAIVTLVAALSVTTAVANDAREAIIVFGDSLTAGYGLEPEQAFPALLQQKVRDAGFEYEVVNAGLSGETTAAGVRRAAWILRRPVAVFILALGGNDGLRGVPVEETARNLQSIVDTVRASQPRTVIIIGGMQSPPNMGPEFTRDFRAIFPALAQSNGLALIPFLLEGVGGEPAMNLPDGIHPNPEGHKIVAENVWQLLEPALKKLRAN